MIKLNKKLLVAIPVVLAIAGVVCIAALAKYYDAEEKDKISPKSEVSLEDGEVCESSISEESSVKETTKKETSLEGTIVSQESTKKEVATVQQTTGKSVVKQETQTYFNWSTVEGFSENNEPSTPDPMTASSQTFPEGELPTFEEPTFPTWTCVKTSEISLDQVLKMKEDGGKFTLAIFKFSDQKRLEYTGTFLSDEETKNLVIYLLDLDKINYEELKLKTGASNDLNALESVLGMQQNLLLATSDLAVNFKDGMLTESISVPCRMALRALLIIK